MDNITTMTMTVLRAARRYAHKLWVRVALMGLLAFLAVGISQLIELYIPETLSRSLDGQAADRLLQLIANAMLAVTIFSITVMVSVYQSSSTQWTPRIHRLIMQDRTTQNTLSVFIGAYVYALLGIILRELDVYDDRQAFVVFWMTVLVLAVIVIYLVRWVLHLQGFGQLTDTTRHVEAVTRARFKERLATPCLGARPLQAKIPEGARSLAAWESGYIEHLYPEALNALAQENGVCIHMARAIGDFVFRDAPLLHIDQGEEIKDWDKFCAQIRDTVLINDVRSYDQDPRFGLIVLGEIGSKALSPGVNDPGTAIDAILRIGRVLSDYKDETEGPLEDRLAHLFVAPLDPVEMLQDGFGTLARDGAGVVEVQQSLQHTLANLMRHPDAKLCAAARDFAQEALMRSLEAIPFSGDRERLLSTVDTDIKDAIK